MHYAANEIVMVIVVKIVSIFFQTDGAKGILYFLMKMYGRITQWRGLVWPQRIRIDCDHHL